ncbi:Uncharacterised protein [Shigella flexneri]|nr:Uncharacterised protein [Shigella flexneri]
MNAFTISAWFDKVFLWSFIQSYKDFIRGTHFSCLTASRFSAGLPRIKCVSFFYSNFNLSFYNRNK